MSRSRLEKRIDALERKIQPTASLSAFEEAFLGILTDDELLTLERAIRLKDSGATEEDAQAWLDGMAPEISFKYDLTSDFILGKRLDEYNRIKQSLLPAYLRDSKARV